jgi:hypothetical protein
MLKFIKGEKHMTETSETTEIITTERIEEIDKLTLDQIHTLEGFGAFGLQKLIRMGGSYVLIIPKRWVELYAYEIEEEDKPTYWMQIMVEEDGNIHISPIDVKDLRATLKLIKEKK